MEFTLNNILLILSSDICIHRSPLSAQYGNLKIYNYITVSVNGHHWMCVNIKYTEKCLCPCSVHKNKQHFTWKVKVKKKNLWSTARKYDAPPPICLLLNRINNNLFCTTINISVYDLDGLSVQNISILSDFLNLPCNPVPSVYLRAHWPRSPQASRSATLHPWPPQLVKL